MLIVYAMLFAPIVAWVAARLVYGGAGVKEAFAGCTNAKGAPPSALALPLAGVFRAWRLKPALAYGKKLKLSLAELYGAGEADAWYWLHTGNKALAVLGALFFCGAVGACSERDIGFYGFCAFAAGGAWFLPDSLLTRKVQARKLDLALDFPEFLVKLTLLINAGQNVAKAWEQAALGMDSRRALGRELALSLAEIRAGKSEAKAYEDFAKRCRMQEATRVASVLLQNLRKGNQELVSILRVQANECWDARKNAARRLGEEASSKMLLPMAILLVAILLIVMTPAMLALQGI